MCWSSCCRRSMIPFRSSMCRWWWSGWSCWWRCSLAMRSWYNWFVALTVLCRWFLHDQKLSLKLPSTNATFASHLISSRQVRRSDLRRHRHSSRRALGNSVLAFVLEDSRPSRERAAQVEVSAAGWSRWNCSWTFSVESAARLGLE